MSRWCAVIKENHLKRTFSFRSHDTTFVVDSKLSALEAKTNHVYERVDMINEKMHDMLKILYNQKVQRSASNCEILDVAITPRLANIEKQITLIQNNHCKTQPKRGRNHNNETQYSPPQLTMTHAEPAGKEVKQLLAVGKKSLNNLEYLSETVTSLNTTTNRLQKSLAICCRNNEVHVMMLRESVDSAFQKLERIYLNLEESIKSGRNHEKANRTKIELEDPSVTDPGEDIDGSGSGSGDKEWREREEAAVEADRSKKAAIKKQTFRSNCHELRGLEDGVYSFGFADDENEQGRKFNHRYCHFDKDNSPGWTVIQRRGDFGGPENFNRSWADYKHGFGALDKEFWYGNDFIHQLTNEEGQVGLRVELLDFRGQRGVVQYSRFYVSSERSFYRLDIQGFGGNVSDSLLYHNQMYFSTFDSANDHSGDIPCALSHGSGWWWNNCLESNLNGKYSQDPHTTHYTGIIWEQWLGDYSLKATTMMIRPVAPNGLWIDNDEVDEVDDGPMMSPPEDP